MIININELIRDYDKEISFSKTLLLSPENDFYNNNALVNVKGRVSKKNDMYLYNGTLTTTLNMVCNNCLNNVDICMEIPIAEVFSDKEVSNEEYEVWLMNNKSIELIPAVLSNIYSNIPSKVLCVDECKGLCHVCGIDLNKKVCDCNNTITDPRFGILKEVFLNKEV